ncbi:histone acetyltransferase type B catalytic subunit [Raphidocelis subcapitata]|uniref:histone acetyltransferase n=1 Tax=Raphidocelis subcapitata TaxID=307507 RepID=A0A2V0PA20_9CHLO|nr:histone acetyltransferase type B catalytic subunit [Raphidocelis subcapitata]|eukprot:GBF96691.1 histone acetyltransferase type B catalytic subunit [Raphidocelis subcapitata]
MTENEPPPAKKVRLAPVEVLKCSAADAFTWHLVDASKLDRELKSGGAMFKCEYYNQPFGEAEEISGYKGLKVDVVDVQFEDRRPKATDVHKALAEWFPSGYSRTRAEFEAAVKAASEAAPDWAGLGAQLSADRLEVGGSPKLLMQHVKLAEAPQWFKDVHARVEPLLVFNVDGASFIDAEDARWEVVAAVLDDGSKQLLAGFMTVYNFYAWPTSARPRVAQVLVLPPYQGAGIGKALLGAAYRLARDRGASDLVFEDPSPELQRAREKLEVEMLLEQDWAASAIAAAIAAAAAAAGDGDEEPLSAAAAARAPPGPLALPAELAARVTAELKIHPHHLKSCWEAAVFCHPAMRAADAALPALEALVARRLGDGSAPGGGDGGGGGGGGGAPGGKRIVEVPREDGQDSDFFMWRPRGAKRTADAAPDGAGAGGSGGGEGGEGGGVVSVGRQGISEVSADEYEGRLEGLLSERLGQLEELRRRLAGEAAASEGEEEEGEEDEMGEEGDE